MKLFAILLLVVFLSPVKAATSTMNDKLKSVALKLRIENRNDQRVNIIKDIFQYNQDSKRSIELSELVQGCARVNCMVAINQPEFAAIEVIDFIRDDDVR